MNEHDSKVEVIEKHYHGENHKQGNGLSIAGLTTGTVGTVGVLGLAGIELVKAISQRIANGGGGRNGGGAMDAVSGVVSAIAPMVAAAVAPRQPAEPRFVPIPIGGGHECSEMAEMRAKIAKLEAEKYSDNAAKEESNRLLQNYLKPYGQEIAANQVVIAKLQGEIECGKKTSELEKKNLELEIKLAKQEAECCCKANATAIQTLASIVGSITKTVVPNSASCPGWGNVTITPAAATTTAG